MLHLGIFLLAAQACTADVELLVPDTKLAKAAADCKFTEGPAVDAEGNIYFSDGPNDRIMKIAKEGPVSVFRHPCGRTNGMKFDQQGRLVMCQSSGAGGGRRVARLEADGTETALAERIDGHPLNAPNDLTIDRQGRIYFTDIAAPPEGQQPDLASGVYRIDGPGTFVRVIEGLLKPNGIVLSADNKMLYVSDRGTQKLHRYQVQADGGLEPDGIVYDFSPDRGIDGMTLDAEGNIWAAAGLDATTGLWVISPQGKLLLHRPMPEFSTNLCFAGQDLCDLYFTAQTSVYKLKSLKPGQKPVAWK
ncbi:MAG: SMP-30/gluconolactonase/LRE family protein [Pirellulales bacterium]